MSAIGLTEGGFSRKQIMDMVVSAGGNINQYIEFTNDSGQDISKGTVLGFNGVETGNSSRIKAIPYIADGSMSVIYIFGIAYSDVPAGSSGYAIVSGRIEGIDTTDFGVGDILYASPNTSGKLTPIKPTAPEFSIVTAACLVSDAVNGALQVRLTIEQEKHYGHFSRTTPLALNGTATSISFDLTEVANGITIGSSTSNIIFAHSGLYSLNMLAQIYSGTSNTRHIRFWYKKNGDVIGMSATSITMNNNLDYKTVSRPDFFSMEAGDILELMVIAEGGAGVSLANAPVYDGAPSSPSISLHITQIQQ